MHTADWWWDVQVEHLLPTHVWKTIADRSQETLPPGPTVVPIIGISDQTNLTNFSGDKKAWLVYLTIGNLPSAQRNSPGSMAVLLTLLLVPPKLLKTSKADRRREKSTLTLCKMYSNSSLHPFRMWRMPASPLTVPMARFDFASQFSQDRKSVV